MSGPLQTGRQGTVLCLPMLFTGCGGSSTATSSDSTPEAGNTETTEASAQEESAAEAPAQDEEKPSAPTGFQHLGYTITDSKGRITYKVTYFEDYRDVSSRIMTFDADNVDVYKYNISLIDREYDEDGKWISSTLYTAQDVTDIEGINLDDFKTEENKTGTEICKYDDNGLVVEESDLAGNLIRTSTYNSLGQLIHSESLNGNKRAIESTYDENGVLIKTVSNSESGDESVEEYTPFGVTSIETFYHEKWSGSEYT